MTSTAEPHGRSVLSSSIPVLAVSSPRVRQKKPIDQYHHGDLSRAMRREAVRLIQADGVAAVTVRAVGARLGVSRTALYRHFPSKAALLASVAAEGFAGLRSALLTAWDGGAVGTAGLEAMGAAYVRFAISHPAYYRLMFGGTVPEDEIGAAIEGQRTDAFTVLVEAIAALQRMRHVRADDPRRVAYFAWAEVHGIAMLALDGLIPPDEDVTALVSFAHARILTGIESRATRSRRGPR